MEKEELIKIVTEKWCEYGRAINTAFGLKGFYIEAITLNEILEHESQEEIQKSLEYISAKIEELQSID